MNFLVMKNASKNCMISNNTGKLGKYQQNQCKNKITLIKVQLYHSRSPNITKLITYCLYCFIKYVEFKFVKIYEKL